MQGKKIENSKEINASQQSKTLQSDTSVAPTEEKDLLNLIPMLSAICIKIGAVLC
jgi:hypothetical protein